MVSEAHSFHFEPVHRHPLSSLGIALMFSAGYAHGDVSIGNILCRGVGQIGPDGIEITPALSFAPDIQGLLADFETSFSPQSPEIWPTHVMVNIYATMPSFTETLSPLC